MRRRILLTGGGSGGHVYPLLAVAHSLQKLAAQYALDLELHYLGPADRYEELFQNEGIRTGTLVAAKVRRYASFANIVDIPKFFIGFLQALWKLFWLMPDVIFSKGGTGALPVVLAGWFYHIPIIIHDSDSIPGATNLVSGRFAKRIAVGFENALQYFNRRKAAVTGNPVREDLLTNPIESALAKEELGFDPAQPLILILGGSLGAQRINEFILLSLKDLVGLTQVLHQTGVANLAEVEKLARAVLIDVPLQAEVKSRYKAAPYFEADYKRALSAADLIVARAGASTIFETAAFGKPAILIPLSDSANDHQRTNAYEFAKTGAAIVIEEANLMPGIFLNQLRTILNDKPLMEKMSGASRNFYKPNAADVIAEEVVRLAQ